jgi:hypothetical protein
MLMRYDATETGDARGARGLVLQRWHSYEEIPRHGFQGGEDLRRSLALEMMGDESQKRIA